MTRLFLRFYVSVIALLLVGLGVIFFASLYRIDANFDSITDRALGGEVKIARDALKAMPSTDAPLALDKLRSQLRYPVQLISEEQAPGVFREWLSKGDEVVVHVNNELSVLTPIGDGATAIRLGPVAMNKGTIETDMILAMGGVLVLVAVAIAILLRPLARQLSLLEQTAISFAKGNFSARVNVEKTDSTKTLAYALNEMAGRTETLLRTQQELLQAVSHELRTPLARISFAIDLTRAARDDEERELRLKSLDTASHDLNDLVGELLQYVRLETGGNQTQYERFEVLPLVREQIERLAIIYDKIQLEVGPVLQSQTLWMFADRSGVARTLANILGNACRFAKNRIILEARESSTSIVMDVDDDGPGIPLSERERVFQPFVRLEIDSDGVGLGLALISRIVANHGGTATILESPLGGCRLRTNWPIAKEVILKLNDTSNQ